MCNIMVNFSEFSDMSTFLSKKREKYFLTCKISKLED